MRQIHAALALVLFSGAAVAQELPRLDDLKACRLDAELVSLSFIYDGGACEQTGDPSVDLVESGTATVTVPIVPTAQICTMQVVKVVSVSAVAVPADVTALNIQLVSPGGEVQAAGKVEVGPHTDDCVPPAGE